MTVTHVSRRAAVSAPSDVDQVALEVSAVTRLLEAEGILDYSGHVSARIPGRDAFAIQIGVTSRAEVAPETMLVVDHAGTVVEGEGELAGGFKMGIPRPDIDHEALVLLVAQPGEPFHDPIHGRGGCQRRERSSRTVRSGTTEPVATAGHPGDSIREDSQ